MAKKLFDHAIGGDAHVALEVQDDGSLGLEVSYSIEKLRAPLTSILQKATAKVGFLNRQIPNIVNGIFTSLGVASIVPDASADAKDVTPAPAGAAAAAHEAAPVEPAAPAV